LCGQALYGSTCGEKGYKLSGVDLDSIQNGITSHTITITDFDKQNAIKFDFPATETKIVGCQCKK
jgi:hypothetical protein